MSATAEGETSTAAAATRAISSSPPAPASASASDSESPGIAAAPYSSMRGATGGPVASSRSITVCTTPGRSLGTCTRQRPSGSTTPLRPA